MNTSSSDPSSSGPLTAEERALAMRLARIGPHGEPSPALDARIIGAAHAATGSSRSATRWPALIGLAATLALAVGITWQLKPFDEPAVERTMQETVSAPAAESADAVMTAPAEVTPQHVPPAPRSAPAPPATREAPREQEARKASGTPATVADPQPTRSSTPPAPPPPVPAAPPVATVSVTADKKAEQDMRTTQDRAALRAERETMSRSAVDRDAAAAAPSPEAFPADAAQEADKAKMRQTAEIPVEQDRGLEPLEWIERIRLRRNAGDIAGARESLLLLRREHPQTRVPSDLDSLAQQQP